MTTDRTHREDTLDHLTTHEETTAPPNHLAGARLHAAIDTADALHRLADIGEVFLALTRDALNARSAPQDGLATAEMADLGMRTNQRGLWMGEPRPEWAENATAVPLGTPQSTALALGDPQALQGPQNRDSGAQR